MDSDFVGHWAGSKEGFVRTEIHRFKFWIILLDISVYSNGVQLLFLQCIINHQALPCLANLLASNHKKSIKKEACWTISNITAGNNDQIQVSGKTMRLSLCLVWNVMSLALHFWPSCIFLFLDACAKINQRYCSHYCVRDLIFELVQAVIEANIFGPLVHLLQNAEFEIKKEASWAISNATSGGTHDQIKYAINYPTLLLYLSFHSLFLKYQCTGWIKICSQVPG